MPLARTRLLPKLPPKALNFDGVNDYVEVPDDPSLRIISMTLEALVYIPSVIPSDWRTIMEHARGTDNWYGLWKSKNGNFFHFRWSRSGTTDFSHIIYPNAWYHVVGVLDASTSPATVRTYQNGEIDKEFTTSALPSEASGVLLIGRSGYGEYWYGYIAFVRIYNRVLTADEIKWNYYHPDDPVRSGLVLWLHYDSIDEENNTWRDKTAYHNDGTIYGATLVEFTKPPIRKLSPTRILSPVR